MSRRTGIEWCDATWNPIVGCSVVSPGCTNCYAMRQADRIRRMAGDASHYFGTTRIVNGNAVWTGKIALAPERTLMEPLRRRKPTVYFVNSMGDLFHEGVPEEWIDRVFAAMALAPHHVFVCLTKRARRMRAYVSEPAVARRITGAAGSVGRNLPTWHPAFSRSGGHWTNDQDGKVTPRWPLFNVVLGVSAEDQPRADERIPVLLATPATVRVVSAEPLLSAINFNRIYLGTPAECSFPSNPEITKIQMTVDALAGAPRTGIPALDGVIVGGESGPDARPMHPDWARLIRDQCEAASVPFFFKQWGEWGSASFLASTGLPIFRQFSTFQEWVNKASTRVRGGACLDAKGHQLHCGQDVMRARDENMFPVTIMDRVGTHRAGRLLDGREHNDLPWRLAAASASAAK